MYGNNEYGCRRIRSSDKEWSETGLSFVIADLFPGKVICISKEESCREVKIGC